LKNKKNMKIMKIYKLSTLLKVCFIIVSCFIFVTACEKADLLDTNQLASKEVTLKVFGPCPIQRGAELRIMGTNLDKVESVILPGSGAITDIKRISNTEIRVLIPQNAEPGPIKLKAGDKEITSITELIFDEPILINSITPLTVKAGSVIKIEGDYLNLIKEIIFADEVHVLKADFKSQSREAIEVVVPIKAQTGKIVVSNGADLISPEEEEKGIEPGIPIWVYSDDELVVILPTITAFSPGTIRAGSELTVTGKDFDLVEGLSFGGGKAAKSFKVNDAKTAITVTVPVDAQDGVIVLTAFSGVKVTSSTALVMVVPTISSISPNPVKNGAVLKVTGTNLDLISKVTFGEEKEGKIKEGATATEISIEVPKDAADGKVTFTTLAEKDVQSAELKFVKPAITNIDPTAILAGTAITITGTDLDLVEKVIFGGNTEGKILDQNETSIEVESLPNSLTDIIILVTTNRTEVKSTQEITITSELPVITSITDQAKPGTIVKIEGTKLNMVESIIFQDNAKATKYGIRSETVIEVYVPDNAKKGRITLTLNTFDGKEVISPEFKVVGTDPIIYPDLLIEDFENHNGHDAGWDNWGGNFEYLTDDEGNRYIQIKSGISGWTWLYGCNHQSNRGSDFPALANPDNYVLKLDMKVTGNYDAGVLFAFSFGGWGRSNSLLTAQDNYTTNGEWATVTVPMTSLWDGAPINGKGDWGMALNSGTIPAGVVIAIDNVRFEPK
jgi:hypothetical protein